MITREQVRLVAVATLEVSKVLLLLPVLIVVACAATVVCIWGHITEEKEKAVSAMSAINTSAGGALVAPAAQGKKPIRCCRSAVQAPTLRSVLAKRRATGKPKGK